MDENPWLIYEADPQYLGSSPSDALTHRMVYILKACHITRTNPSDSICRDETEIGHSWHMKANLSINAMPAWHFHQGGSFLELSSGPRVYEFQSFICR
jgi:hypothetical protein